MPPQRPPIGLQLARAARLISRAFDDALAAADGSLPVWLVLLNLKIRHVVNQRELATAVGVSGPTLTHHLNAMEANGLLMRRRDPANRRNHIIELTDQGEESFLRLRDAASAFDLQLRAGLQPQDALALNAILQRLCSNVATDDGGPAWAGLIEGA